MENNFIRIVYTRGGDILYNANPIYTDDLDFITIEIDKNKMTGIIYKNDIPCYTCNGRSVQVIRRKIRKFLQREFGLFTYKERHNNVGELRGISDNHIIRIIEDDEGLV